MTHVVARFGALALFILVALAASAGAAGGYYPNVPQRVERILEHDWCHAGPYKHARGVASHLTDPQRRNIAESEQTPRAHPRGCLIGERAAHRRGRPLYFPRHPAWTEPGPHGDDCPRDPLPGGTHWRHAASLAAAAADARSLRPIVVGRGGPGHQTRRGQIRHACGRAAVRRSVVIGIQLSALFPSASASTQILALARFRHLGWRVWMILH